MNRFQVKEIPLELIDDFPDHPYRVRDDSSMIELTQSIIDNGVLVPAIVRPKRDGRYEMISGHRRRRASQLAGIDKLKCIVGDYDDLTAIVIMVDSNLHRENVLPSEKAFAYKMRLEAMNVQGQRNDLTSTPLVSKCRTNELLAEQVGESREQIRRYIRLTYLVPELLEYIDNGNIKMRPAVEMSYLDEETQRDIVDFIDENEVYPSHAQTIRIRKLFESGKLDNKTLEEIMSEDKPNQKEHISIPIEKISGKLPKTPSKRTEFIINAVDHYYKFLQRQKYKESR